MRKAGCRMSLSQILQLAPVGAGWGVGRAWGRCLVRLSPSLVGCDPQVDSVRIHCLEVLEKKHTLDYATSIAFSGLRADEGSCGEGT